MICLINIRFLDIQKVKGKKTVASEWQSSPSFILQALAGHLLCARQMFQVLGDKIE